MFAISALLFPITYLLVIIGIIYYIFNFLNKIIRLKEEQNSLLKELILKLKN